MIRLRIAAIAPAAQPRAVPVRPGATLPERLAAAASAAGFRTEPSQICEAFDQSGRVVLVGAGGDLRVAGAAAACCLLGTARITLDARDISPAEAADFTAGAVARAWRFSLATRPIEEAPKLVAIDLLTNHPAATRTAWNRERAGLEAQGFARDLVAEPSNSLTPQGFVARLRTKLHGDLALATLEGAALRQAGLGGLLAVGSGSAHPPLLAVLRWPGAAASPPTASAPVVFVGKGITFDTGGLCVKPAAGMEEMRADMAGAAAAAGAVLALAARRSPCPAIAVLALAENALGAASYRPSDVLHMADGSTVEVVDTDAEGRLVLADALAWSRHALRPRAMLDLATLTGSIVTALGHHRAGLFANHEALAAAAAAAGEATGETLWRMPIGTRHRADLRSDIADLRHCLPGRGHPDACHAAAFLAEFAGDTPWAHLDIAGVEAHAEASPHHAAGPTGFGVRLLDRLVAAHFEMPAGPL